MLAVEFWDLDLEYVGVGVGIGGFAFGDTISCEVYL